MLCPLPLGLGLVRQDDSPPKEDQEVRVMEMQLHATEILPDAKLTSEDTGPRD